MPIARINDHDMYYEVLGQGEPVLCMGGWGSFCRDNHHHLVCRSCGRTEDVCCAVGEAPCLKAHSHHGFRIDEAEVIYWGTCPACQKKKR